MSTYAVILAGGRGERLWPVSAEDRPKPLLPLAPGGRSLVRATFERVLPLVGPEGVRVVADGALAAAVGEELGLGPGQLIVEPEGRSTAPAVGLAATVLSSEDQEALMIVLPADHLIRDEEVFRDVLQAAVEAARRGHLVTLGVEPSSASGAYGYIQRGEVLLEVSGRPVFRAGRFVEKPDPEVARRISEEGDWLWNAGIFVWKASRVLAEIRQHLPALAEALEGIRKGSGSASVWGAVPPISVDHGIMERATDVAVVPLEAGWSDVGDWRSLWEAMPHDKRDVALRGQHIGEDTTRTLVWTSPGKLVATLGVRDLAIVDSPEALLVADMGKAQQVRDLARRARIGPPDWLQLGARDEGGMLDVLSGFPGQCRAALAAGAQAEVDQALAGFERILYVGMGGSGFAGDMLSLLQEAAVTVWKGYDVPAWLSSETLLVGVSYSGNTEETLSAFSRGLTKTRRALALTSGGRLAELCRAEGVPWIPLPSGYQPRAALGHLLFTLFPVLAKLGLATPDVGPALACLEKLATELGPQNRDNAAQRLSLLLRDRLPLVYGAHPLTGPVAMRWKTQINENAKQPACWAEVPELCHNEIVGYELAGRLMPRSVAVFLRTSFDHTRISERIEILKGVLRRRDLQFVEVHGRGDDPVAQAFSLLYMGDWVSVYLALLNGVDPTPVRPIEELKEKLAAGRQADSL